jgi:hypothetical protein
MAEGSLLTATDVISVPHVIRGRVIDDPVVEHSLSTGTRFATPALDLDQLVWPRTEPLPAAEIPLAEVIDVLAATGEQLRTDAGGILQEVFASLELMSPYERQVLETCFTEMWRRFDPDGLRLMVEGEMGSLDVLDGWRPAGPGRLSTGSSRAYPARLIHVLAGNVPDVAAITVIRGALTKGVHLLKMPSNDLLAATAVLRALAAAAPGHPVTQSFSAVYWKGGDPAVEGILCRPQFFDKLIAWGGENAIRNAVRYVGPGFELVSFDPKNSISMVGREAFASDQTLAEVANLGATDAAVYNQEGCIASRFQYVEGDLDEVDRYCEQLRIALGAERKYTSAVVRPPPAGLRDDVSALARLAPLYRVFGEPDGRGMVVRSDEPVDFYPSGKTVNVVAVGTLADAVKYVDVSTQTIGIYPPARKAELRNALASAGAQRIVNLGRASGTAPGYPADGFYPMNRMVRWIGDEG